ncbi:mitochondrial carrier domain-containing protein [Syncephalis pseudoplumigaleata]|uniref:Mitochondrial carrier domain-containing protein n=1 Tax=Syncephalis pseudoplumigaleata TaxID=1712513 RepID=A0A4P9Z2V3_9FUNG|nr:mitochondrial carrier domain-containing protein [Syncephalis pseudoplumigaleata]|eukprot:RKP25810.1 mitochondrial carrier domain-containing protein [Syncephalis pseudoplumigaleata]
MSKVALSPFGNAVAGAGGAIFSLICVYPLDIVKTRLQVQSSTSIVKYTSTTDAIRRVLSEEGLRGLYAGLPAGLVGVASTNFAYFYWYSTLRGNYRRFVSREISTAWELLLGAGAGALAQLFTIPVSVVVTRQQTQPKKDRKGFAGTWWEIVEEDGWTGLWRGLRPSLVLVVNPSITYGAFEKLKDAWLHRMHRAQLSSLEVFVISAIAKTIATVVTYPYIMAKVRMQWKPSREERATGRAVRYRSAIHVLKKVYATDGLRGWYNGMQAQISKAVLSQALMMMIKEKLTLYTILLFALFRRNAAS